MPTPASGRYRADEDLDAEDDEELEAWDDEFGNEEDFSDDDDVGADPPRRACCPMLRQGCAASAVLCARLRFQYRSQTASCASCHRMHPHLCPPTISSTV